MNSINELVQFDALALTQRSRFLVPARHIDVHRRHIYRSQSQRALSAWRGVDEGFVDWRSGSGAGGAAV